MLELFYKPWCPDVETLLQGTHCRRLSSRTDAADSALRVAEKDELSFCFFISYITFSLPSAEEEQQMRGTEYSNQRGIYKFPLL